MADLKVDYDQLTSSYTALTRLYDEFDHATDTAHAADDIWGDGHVQDAIDDFASNWKLHREKLLAKMQNVGEMTTTCIETFEKADEGIASGVTVQRQ